MREAKMSVVCPICHLRVAPPEGVGCNGMVLHRACVWKAAAPPEDAAIGLAVKAVISAVRKSSWNEPERIGRWGAVLQAYRGWHDTVFGEGRREDDCAAGPTVGQELSATKSLYFAIADFLRVLPCQPRFAADRIMLVDTMLHLRQAAKRHLFADLPAVRPVGERMEVLRRERVLHKEIMDIASVWLEIIFRIPKFAGAHAAVPV